MPQFLPDPVLLLLAALALDWLLGDPRRFHPVAGLGRLIALLDRQCNRAAAAPARRRLAGMLAALAVVALAAALGWLAHRLLAALPYGWLAEAAVISLLLAARGLYRHVRAVAVELDAAGLAGARAAVARIAGRDPQALDGHGVARTAVESLAENFSDAVIAPVFWYLLLGLPGLCACKAVNTLDSMIGYRTDRHADFGRFAARLDDAVNWLPARLTAALLLLAALPLPGADARRGWLAVRRTAAAHPSPNAGWPEAALAGALDFRLGGPRRYPGGVMENSWIGLGRAALTAADIRRALRLYLLANGLLFLLTGGLALVF